MCAAINVADADDMGAGREGLQDCGCCGGAGGECEGVVGVFEGCEGGFEVFSVDEEICQYLMCRSAEVGDKGVAYRFGFAERVYS